MSRSTTWDRTARHRRQRRWNRCAKGFAESGYDIKWLFQAICATEAYQRESRPRREVNGTPFVANVAQPLRSDQLFNALLSAVGYAGAAEVARIARGRQQGAKPRYGLNASPRQAFEVAFGYDPSDPRETVNASIPQALALMNGVRINLAVRAIGDETMLGRLLDDDPATTVPWWKNFICGRCRASRRTKK